MGKFSRTLTEADASIIKGLLLRGDCQHQIAAWFGVNPGRVAEISTGQRFYWVAAALSAELPSRENIALTKNVPALVSKLHGLEKRLAELEQGFGQDKKVA